MLAAALTAAACASNSSPDPAVSPTPSPSPTPTCSIGFIGSSSAAPELSLVARTSANTTLALTNSAAVPLLTAPQGGFLVFAGSRVKNVDGCGLTVTADLRDPGTGLVIGFESRPVTLALDSNGYGVPANPAALSDFANVPACPSGAATRSVVGSAYLLEMTITDSASRTKSAALTVTPYCGEPGDPGYCQTLCAPPP